MQLEDNALLIPTEKETRLCGEVFIQFLMHLAQKLVINLYYKVRLWSLLTLWLDAIHTY